MWNFGHAYSKTATSGAMTVLSQTYECPKFTMIAVCNDSHLHIDLQPSQLTSGIQLIADKSTNSLTATNGYSSSVQTYDAASSLGGFYFQGGKVVSLPVLATSSYYGYTLVLQVVLTQNAVSHLVYKDDNLQIKITTSDIELTFASVTVQAGCPSFSQVLNKGYFLGVVSYVSSAATKTSFSVYWESGYCSTQEINASFLPLTTGYLGPSLVGVIRRFMILKAVLGQESFLSYAPSCDQVCATCYGPSSTDCIEFFCPQGQYYSGSSCEACDGSCPTTCTGPSSSECTSCGPDQYQEGAQCLQCDELCDGCTGQGSTNCVACALNINLVSGTNTCVISCVDYAPNYYDAGNTCDICSSSCYNCGGPLESECYDCALGSLEVLSSPSASPKHCASTCPTGYYTDSPFCRECASNCEVCSGPAGSDCTQCQPGFYLESSPAQCTSTCPIGFYENPSTSLCEACHASCLACSGPNTNDCLSCQSGLSFQADGTCTCPDGSYFNDLLASCDPCSSSCANCDTSATSCTSCPSPAILVSSQCLCPDSSLFTGNCPCSTTSSDGDCLYCGDGILHLGEACDDGNQESADGCSATCQVQDQFNCNATVTPTSCTPIATISITQILFSTSVEGIKVTLQFSSLVKLTGFSATSISVSHPFSPSTSVKVQETTDSNVSSLSFTINPQTSISDTSEIQFSLDTSSIQPVDQNTKIPDTITKSPKLPSYDYVDPVVVDIAQILEHTLSSFTTVSLPSSIVAQLLMSISMEPLWIFINTNQLLFYIPLMQVNFPGNALVLFKVLSFANGDLLLLVLLYDHTIGRLIPEGSSSAFAPNFQLLGYESTSLIDNAGIFYSFLFFQLFIICLLVACGKILNQTIGRACSRCADKMLCNPLIRTFFQVYLEVMLCAAMTVHEMNLSSSFELASYTLAGFTLIVGILVGAMLIRITAYPASDLTDSDSIISRRYKEAYSMLNVKRSFMASNYFTWFLFRRMIIIVTLLFLFKYPLLQILLHIALSVIDLIILLRAKPFLLRMDQCFNIFNSVFLLALYFLVILIHYFSHLPKMKETLGWIMILGVAGINVVNILALTILKIVQLLKKCKQRRKRKLEEIEAKYKPELACHRGQISMMSLFQKVHPVTSGQPLGAEEGGFEDMRIQERRPELRKISKPSNELKQIY